MSVTQAMFSVVLHDSGSPASSDTPSASGPLNCGYRSSLAVPATEKITMSAAERQRPSRFMDIILPLRSDSATSSSVC